MCNSGNGRKARKTVGKVPKSMSRHPKVSRFSLPAAIKRQWIRIFRSPPKLRPFHPPFRPLWGREKGRGQLSDALENEEHLSGIVRQQLALSDVNFKFFGRVLCNLLI